LLVFAPPPFASRDKSGYVRQWDVGAMHPAVLMARGVRLR